MVDLEDLIAEAVRDGLGQLLIQESVGGWQAIAKFKSRITGPWDVGCDANAETALRKALYCRKAESAPVPDFDDIFG